ncbi:hypothetical protein L218DRAFT_900741 [Marasmius fiardii PR-910]|nr:hypothetical protein L218DRAFT_900741 [Marasmius fiardii PR-910]
MSSDEGSSQPRQASAKKRRLQGACDMCSDSAKMPGSKCSPCLSFNLQCTHNDPVKKRGPKSVYVAYLEGRIKTLEDELDQFKAQGSRDSAKSPRAKDHPSPEDVGSPITKLRSSPSDFHIPSQTSPDSSHTPGLSDEEDLEYLALLKHTKNLSLNVMENRFFGQSSSFAYTKNAYRVKKEVTGGDIEDSHVYKRSKFWATQPWERRPTWPEYKFPDRDLMSSLIDLYFAKVNSLLPILHAPIFQSSVQRDLHLRDEHFAATVLLVCALGSRYSDDPRVLSAPGHYLSSGWKWYEQAQTFRRSSFDPSSLYELQYHCLVTLYVHAATSITAAWTSVGSGIRFAIELGAHRRKPDGHKLTIEDELKRRAFWVLVILDRSISSFLGRPGSLREEDFDVEMPVECDDEYWDQSSFPHLAYNQPSNKPSKISAFSCLIRLCSISAFAMRTIYSIKKSRLISGVFGDQWEKRVINELDSSMRYWLFSLPEHLKWTSDRKPDGVFFSQSAYIHTMFYDTQIQIHKPFCEKAGLSPLPSAVICTESARACIDILDKHLVHEPLGMPDVVCTTYSATVTLTVDVWRSKRDGVKLESSEMIDDIRKGLNLLKSCEERWSLAGRFRDFVTDMANLSGDVSAPTDVNTQEFVIREPWNSYLQTEIGSPVQVGHFPGERTTQLQHQHGNQYQQQQLQAPPQQDPSGNRYNYQRKNELSESPTPDRSLRTPYTATHDAQELGNAYTTGRYTNAGDAQHRLEMSYARTAQAQGGYPQQPPQYGLETRTDQQAQQQQQARYVSEHDVGMSGMPGMQQQQQQQMNVSGWQNQNQGQGAYQGYSFNDLGHYVESMAYLNGFMIRQPDYSTSYQQHM